MVFLSPLLLRRLALAEDDVAVLGKERRQMFLPVPPFVRSEFMIVFEIISSKFCHRFDNIFRIFSRIRFFSN